MLNKKIMLGMIACLIFVSGVYAKDEAVIKVGSPAPDFLLKSLDGKEYSLKSYSGKSIIYLNFFATWCASCKEEIPQLVKLNEKYKGQGMVMFGVDVKEETRKISRFVEKNKIQYTILLDDEAVLVKKYALKGFPLSIIVDGNGIIQYMGSRPPEKFEELFAKLKPTIKVKPKGEEKTNK